MIPDLIARYTHLDPEAVANVWTVLVTNGVAVTTWIAVRKCLAPARAVLRWLRSTPPEPSPLCAAILVALADSSTAEERPGTITCPARSFVLTTWNGDCPAPYTIYVGGRECNRLLDLNRHDRRRVRDAVRDLRVRLAYRQLRDDTDRLLTYKDPAATAKQGKFVIVDLKEKAS